MFSFRTTPISEQLDRGLLDGRVACFCTPGSWSSSSQSFLEDIFRARGNLVRVFSPAGAEFSPEAGHIDFSIEELEGLDAVVVEIQDCGSRYFGPTRDVDAWTPKVAHRHGLTLGELCNLYCSEIGARFPLHVISALCSDEGRDLLPWAIAPAPDLPGLFSCEMYSGGALWTETSVTPGIGTPRPYEYIGAPFLSNAAVPPSPQGVLMRPCSFQPAWGMYAGQVCHGYQIILLPGAPYHSLLHTIQLMRWVADRDSRFEISPALLDRIDDPVVSEYLRGGITFDIVQEHVKLEEQKWIRKAKRFLLYDDAPYRIK